MHVRGVPGQQHASHAIGRGLPVMSENLEIHVASWIPKSVPYTAMSASLSSRRVGSPPGPGCCSVVTTRNVFPSSSLWRPWTPAAS